MRKIETLRDAIYGALPELKRDTDRIRIWIERGTVKSTLTENRGMCFAFQLNVLVVEMATDLAVLALAVFMWLRTNQPELMVPNAEGFTFDADILDNQTADVLIQLQLDQVVVATPNADGSVALDYRGEPDPLFTDLLSITGMEPPPVLTGFDATEDLPPWDD
ncbi:phage tail protein [Novosphingobium clariflavum]|uniref:Phage tail protein n=1 Tax=Novosphingobium clariflavum TaxID=2029884 RepID=A0ABV6S8M6_9SPHN|nr:phage tail protein [Novosphingobium clariflavum]